MLRKTLILTSILTLTACNSDDRDNQTHNPTPTPTPPAYVEPEIIIVGHRGASALRPEHTLEAYQKAIEDGADFIEPDLVPTKDGYLVARHENEIGGTTNVSELPQFADRKTTKIIDGVSLTGWFTEDFTLSELKQLKARERIPDIRPQNTQYNDQFLVPTIEEIIELAYQHYHKTGKIIGLYIETKHPTYFQDLNLAMEDRLLSSLAKYEYSRSIAPVYLQSFEVKNLQYLRSQLDRLNTLQHAKIIQLYSGQSSQPADALKAGLGTTYGQLASAEGLKTVAQYADGVGPSKTYIVSNQGVITNFVSLAHAQDLKVHPYTLRPENEFLPDRLDCSPNPAEKCETGALAEFEIFFKAGVDGVFTDDPGLGRQAADLFLKQ